MCAGNIRTPMPEWKKNVDRTLWAYSRAKHALEYQEALAKELACNWEEQRLRHKEAPKLADELERTRQRCQALRRRRETVENLLNWAFPAGTENGNSLRPTG